MSKQLLWREVPIMVTTFTILHLVIAVLLVVVVLGQEGKQVFVLGHPEYDRMTLDNEYKRDIGKGLQIDIPKNYYPNDDEMQKPKLQWRPHGNIMYSNWLNYYVYQETPYNINDIKE